MTITVELPKDVAQHADPGKDALEALVVEGYRKGALSHYRSSKLPGLLKARAIYDHAYDVDDLDRDLADLRKFEAHVLAQ